MTDSTHLLRAAKLAILCASAGLFLASAAFLFRFVTAVTPVMIWDYGWYYALPIEAENVAVLAAWIGILGIAMPSPKRLILACLLLLNLAYLYTSEAFWASSGIGNAIENFELRVAWRFFPSLFVLDYVCLCLLSIVLVMVIIAYRRRGLFEVILRVLQIGSIAVLPLGLEIYLFFPETMNMDVVSAQGDTILQGFTNLDLLYASTGVLVASCIVLVLRALAKRSRPQTVIV